MVKGFLKPPLHNDYSGTRKENLYSLIRKNNNRLEKIKELEEKI